jgi:murein DD-endopeptidase MepM/ murein hydrolase activator NlpD
MSQFQGSDRHVTTGTVIGLLGQTGDAAAPHLHFEVRVGGVNGSRVDPYPVLQAALC